METKCAKLHRIISFLIFLLLLHHKLNIIFLPPLHQLAELQMEMQTTKSIKNAPRYPQSTHQLIPQQFYCDSIYAYIISRNPKYTPSSV